MTFSVDLDDPDVPLIEKATAVLMGRCGSCHGPDLKDCCNGLWYIDDFLKLIETGKLIACRWTDSRLYARIARAEMPPVNANLDPPTGAELDLVADFVNGLCDELISDDPLTSGRAQIESWLASDCGNCHGSAPPDAGASAFVPLPLDIPQLIEQGLIVPCRPDLSVLMRRLTDVSMPHPDSTDAQPRPDQLRALAELIERPCSALSAPRR